MQRFVLTARALSKQVAQAGVEHPHRGVVRAEPQGLLGQRGVRVGTRDPAAERPPPQLLPPPSAERPFPASTMGGKISPNGARPVTAPGGERRNY